MPPNPSRPPGGHLAPRGKSPLLSKEYVEACNIMNEETMFKACSLLMNEDVSEDSVKLMEIYETCVKAAAVVEKEAIVLPTASSMSKLCLPPIASGNSMPGVRSANRLGLSQLNRRFPGGVQKAGPPHQQIQRFKMKSQSARSVIDTSEHSSGGESSVTTPQQSRQQHANKLLKRTGSRQFAAPPVAKGSSEPPQSALQFLAKLNSQSAATEETQRKATMKRPSPPLSKGNKRVHQQKGAIQDIDDREKHNGESPPSLEATKRKRADSVNSSIPVEDEATKYGSYCDNEDTVANGRSRRSTRSSASMVDMDSFDEEDEDDEEEMEESEEDDPALEFDDDDDDGLQREADPDDEDADEMEAEEEQIYTENERNTSGRPARSRKTAESDKPGCPTRERRSRVAKNSSPANPERGGPKGTRVQPSRRGKA